MIVHKAFQYRIYPTRAQEAALTWTLVRCRELYNAGLEERREAYRMCGISISGAVQQAQLPTIKVVRPEYRDLDAQMLQDVLQRLDRAFSAFFRRVKAGQTPGYPRFKSRDRYNSFTFKQTGWTLDAARLTLRGIGALKVKLHRPVEGTIKTVTIRRDADAWYVSFSCAVTVTDVAPNPDLPAVGLAVGLEHFASFSHGDPIPNPRYFRTGEALLARRQQALARKKRGSARRRKAKVLVRKAHRMVRNQRRDFHHKTARTLVQRHRCIAVEALQISNMTKRAKPVLDEEQRVAPGKPVYAKNGAAAKSGLNKSINDAGWGQFIAFLTYKAAEAGCQVVQVNPAGTSQACSGCGVVVRKALDCRWHHCEHCGLSIQRDRNAALNILARAGQARLSGAVP